MSTDSPGYSANQARILREADKRTNLTATTVLIMERPLKLSTRRAIRRFRLRKAVRNLPAVGRLARAVYRGTKGRAS